jgi:hypothetical protein
MSETDFKRECEGLVREYFTHGVLADVEDSLRELLGRAACGTPGTKKTTATRVISASEDTVTNGDVSHPPPPPRPRPPPRPPPSSTLTANSLHAIVVKRAVTAALDRGAREREMAAALLRTLRVHDVISQPRMEAGFDLILQDVDSLAIDVPNAPDELAVFLARAVIDDVVSNEYLDECADASGFDVVPHAVALSARGALSAPGGPAHVCMAWGGPDGATAGAVRKEMDHLLEEYVSSRDAREAFRRLAELAVPFYHHEFVKRALSLSMDQAHVNTQCPRRVMELLGYLSNTGLINGTQFAKGFARIATALKEMVLDIPDAQEQLEALVVDARGRGLLPAGLSAWATFRGGGFGGGVGRSGGGDGGGGGGGGGGAEGGGGGGAEGGGLNNRGRGGVSGGGLRGHLMRLDSAPDLIKLAETVSKKEGSVKVSSRLGSVVGGGGSGGGGRNRRNSQDESEEAAAYGGALDGIDTTVKTAGAAVDTASGSGLLSSSGLGKLDTAMTAAAAAAALLSALPPRVSTSNQVNAGWSGLRAPRANRSARFGGGGGQSGGGGGVDSGSDADFRGKPKRPLPSILVSAPSSTAGASSALKSPGLPFLAAHTHRPTLGKSAWRARYEPAPPRVSGVGRFVCHRHCHSTPAAGYQMFLH